MANYQTFYIWIHFYAPLCTDTVKKVTFKLIFLYLYFLKILDGLNLLNFWFLAKKYVKWETKFLTERSNNALVTVHLLIIIISWFAGLSAWSSKKVMNLTERGESFLTMGWNILRTSNSIFIQLRFHEMHLHNIHVYILQVFFDLQTWCYYR